MKKNKIFRIVLVALVLCSMLALVACGSKKEGTDVSGTTWVLSGGSQGKIEVTK